ncbi:hypothetical protein SBA4_2440014 [Candidatus Sulfopaludibacter sp. SbA4]|nr:hypothetical protein SBA4_2440014 [Candidatus Sulfopaludibacter sp. SbA4]
MVLNQPRRLPAPGRGSEVLFGAGLTKGRPVGSRCRRLDRLFQNSSRNRGESFPQVRYFAGL